MGEIARRDFSNGWNPSVDAINAPPGTCLRADNLVLDELGVLGLRQGSAKINASALASTDCHSLYTLSLSGTRYRMTGATDAVFANGTSIATGLNGSNDIYFGAHMGQILFARGTTKKKYDGTTVRTWGIAAPGAAPTLAALAADSKVFASCASTEAPIMTVNEGTLAFQPDKAGTANAAVELTPDSTTARATATKTFAGATDFTTYDAGQTGTDEDLLDFYNYVTEPQYIDSMVLMIDVNDGTFQLDWYEHTFKNGDATEVASTEDSLDSIYTAEGTGRDVIRAKILSEGNNQIIDGFRSDKPVVNAGWNHFNIKRGQMDRHGLTSGKNWSTVKAVRVVVTGIAGGSVAAVRFDEIQIIGGAARPLTGKFKAAIVAVRNDGTYEAKSAPTTFSAELEVKAQGIRATLDAGTVNAMDSQVNELWLYLMGGSLPAFYRFTKLTGGPFAGAQTIDATSSEITALIANVAMETDSAVPPSTIIGIEGPHYDRTMCLTASYLYPSRQRNPDSYSAAEVVRVGDAAETALWIKKANEQLYMGTTRDIYRFDGDWTPLPDGTINVAKRPLGVTSPPVSAAVTVGTVNGADILVYLASDGWRVLGGGLLTDDSVSLLWRGYTRHGVSPVNITGTTARFRCALTKGVLYAITPEGSDTTSSTAVHAYSFARQKWSHLVYPQAFRSIYAEPDGTLIAGDASGFVRTLDSATQQDDGSNIAVVLWTPSEDNGELFTAKEPQNLLVRADTGSATATIALHLDGSSLADSSVTTSQAVTDSGAINIRSTSEFKQVQLRLTGSFSTFRFRGYALRYLDRPLGMLVHDTGYVDLTDTTLAWVKRINVKARSSVNLTVQPYWDGVAGTARTITVTAGKEVTYAVPLGREDKGTTARVVVTSTSASNVYWIELEYNVSGKMRQKRLSLVPAA